MSAPHDLCPYDALGAVGFGASVGYVVALAIEADDEHGASVAIAGGLVGSENRGISAGWGCIANTLAEAAMAELVGAAEELDGIVGIVRSQRGLHGAEVLVAKRKDVRPHAK